jgi:coenzyme F420 biosynthesis associated uncharacterized protein
MVDWSLARQIARLAAGSSGSPTTAGDLSAQVDEALVAVTGYTGLALSGQAPTPEVVHRAGWAQINLESLARLLEPVAGRLDRRLDAAGPLAGALRLGADATLAAEAGLVMGYLSQRVLGQYELALLAPDVPPRLLFVTPNLHQAAEDMEVDRESFEGWVAAHEVTHVVQFGAVPWLREHLGELIRRYMDTVDVRIGRGNAGALPRLPNPRELVERFSEGGLAALVQTRTQRRLMSRLQATMAVIEGYSEHVMDAVAPGLVAEHEGLRDAMERRRGNRSAPERVLSRLLGFDMKLRQYQEGRRFCDAVVAELGIEGLNRVWEGPRALPNLAELRRPEAWSARVAAGTFAAA